LQTRSGGVRIPAMAKDGLPPIRIDAVHAVVTALEVLVVLGTLKVIAYRYHGNPLSQAFLLIA
jgi:hypothetical protein